MLFTPLALAHAQGGVGSTRGLPDSAGGIHMIQGKVYLPSGRRAGAGIAVRLEGNVVGSRLAATDGDGSFLFRSLPAADYTIVVDAGSEYETVRESVVIYGTTGGVSGVGPAGQTIMVDIHLRPKSAAENADKMFARFPREAVDSYKKGLDAAHGGDSKKAVELFRQAVYLAPTFVAALNELGGQYLKLGQWDKAAETYQALLKLKPDDAAAQLSLGIALFNLKKYEDAETSLRESLKLNNKIASPHYYLGMTLLSLKRYAEAQTELELAISNGGENLAQAHRYLGGLYISAHKNKEAADELEKYLKLEPKAADAERIRGIIKDLRSKQ